MEKECCNVKFSETEKGFRIDVIGEKIKEKCKSMMENCCGESKTWQEFLKNCCPTTPKNS